jgi:hypothetical protein
MNLWHWLGYPKPVKSTPRWYRLLVSPDDLEPHYRHIHLDVYCENWWMSHVLFVCCIAWVGILMVGLFLLGASAFTGVAHALAHS